MQSRHLILAVDHDLDDLRHLRHPSSNRTRLAVVTGPFYQHGCSIRRVLTEEAQDARWPILADRTATTVALLSFQAVQARAHGHDGQVYSAAGSMTSTTSMICSGTWPQRTQGCGSPSTGATVPSGKCRAVNSTIRPRRS